MLKSSLQKRSDFLHFLKNNIHQIDPAFHIIDVSLPVLDGKFRAEFVTTNDQNQFFLIKIFPELNSEILFYLLKLCAWLKDNRGLLEHFYRSKGNMLPSQFIIYIFVNKISEELNSILQQLQGFPIGIYTYEGTLFSDHSGWMFSRYDFESDEYHEVQDLKSAIQQLNRHFKKQQKQQPKKNIFDGPLLNQDEINDFLNLSNTNQESFDEPEWEEEFSDDEITVSVNIASEI